MSKWDTYQTDSNNRSIEPVVVSNQPLNDFIVKDTIYGITNEKAIPHREDAENVVLKNRQEQTALEVLFSPTELKTKVYAWQTILLLFGLFLVAFVKAFSNNRFKESYKAIINYSVAQEITREEKVFFHRVNLFLSLNYIVCVSLFILFLNNIINVNTKATTINLYLTILLFIIVVYTVKFAFSKVLFFVFNDINLSNEYIFNVTLYNNLLGIFFIPILGLCYFSGFNVDFILKYIALPLISISLILRLVRQVVIGKSKGVSYFYIFLYICTLEILPLVVLYRFFILK